MGISRPDPGPVPRRLPRRRRDRAVLPSEPQRFPPYLGRPV